MTETPQPSRLHPAQGRLRATPAPDRGPGPRPAADGRGGEVLHRHPHPDLRHHEGPAVGRARPARRAPEALRRRRGVRRRPGGRGEAPGGLRRDRPARPLLKASAEEPAGVETRVPARNRCTVSSVRRRDLDRTVRGETATPMAAWACRRFVAEHVDQLAYFESRPPQGRGCSRGMEAIHGGRPGAGGATHRGVSGKAHLDCQQSTGFDILSS